MYVSVGMYGLETEVKSPSTTAGGALTSSLQWPLPEPQQTASTSALRQGALLLLRGYSVWKHRAFFWCLDLGAASLVPLSVERSSFQYVYHGCSEATLF